MKVLRNVLEQQQAAGGTGNAMAAPALQGLELISDVEPSPVPQLAHPPRPRPRTRRGIAGWKALSLAVALAVVAASLTWLVEQYLRPGVLVITSNPPGAEVVIDGQAMSGATPTVVDGVSLVHPLSIVFSARDRKSATVTLQPKFGQLVRRVYAELPSALGELVVESDPPGAQVQIDERFAGITPLTIAHVRLDQPHRIDLALAAHELDQFVVLPEKDGQHFLRTLTPARRSGLR